MKLNPLVLALPALFSLSATVQAAAFPQDPFEPKQKSPVVADILSNAAYSDDGERISNVWDSVYRAKIDDYKYIYDREIVRTRLDAMGQILTISNNSYSLNTTINSVQFTMESDSIAVGTVVKGTVSDGSKILGGFLQLSSTSKAFDTLVESDGSISVRNGAEAYNTTVMAGGIQVVGDGGYAQANLIDGGTQQLSVMSTAVVEDTLVKNGGEQIIYGGTATNSHIGSGSYQLASGVAIDTKVYDGGFQLVYAGSGDEKISDQDGTIYAGGRQLVQAGISDGAQVYGWQLITAADGKWQNGDWVMDGTSVSRQQKSTNATIYAGGRQQVQTGISDGAKVYGLQVVSGSKGGWVSGQWVDQDEWIGKRPLVQNATIYSGGEQRVDYYGEAKGTLIDGGSQFVDERGHVENTTIQGNGRSTITYGGYSTGIMDVNDGSLTMIGGDSHSWTGNLGKGAYASSVNLNGKNSRLYVQHNDMTSESTATVADLAINSGSVIFGRQDGSDAGKYSRLELETLSGSGTFVMNTNINGGVGDFLNISDSISGAFNVNVRDSGQELRAVAAGVDPHHLIFANGSATDSFTLVNGSVDLGAYKYYLVQGDAGDQDNWYLSPTAVEPEEPGPVDPEEPGPGPGPVDPEIPGGENPGGVSPNPKPELSDSAKSVIALANVTPTIWDGELSTLRARLGDLRDNRGPQNGAWGKYITNRYRVSTDNVSYKQDMNGVMLGGDHGIELDGGRLIIGGLFSYTHSELDSRSGDGKVDSYALGLYTTWLMDNGYYLDGVLKANHFRTENNARFNDGKTKGTDNTNGIGISLEAGKHIKLDSYFIEPYLLGSAFHGGKTSYKLDSDMKVKADSAQSLKVEAGTTFGKSFVLADGTIIKPYGRLAVSHEFKKNNDVIINDTERFTNDMSGTVGKYGVGFTAQFNDQWSTYAEINYANGSHIEMPYSGHLGVRYSF
ncbi:autotransporter outer membrane beta-barrel domain-containing protein [Limnobaculum xujianqingii]|uniref:autotransporter outer membrane beta-barrel domain-containing protein n=1 Tax=Limnobaculum xujianqingii TaxID=2738837 RepID=UPI001127E4BC|nr:autotransporter outer membrane beta-barrel domain-containing protein [Limnobaculum xujianqingii]